MLWISCQAFIISFSSDFIPKLVYLASISMDGTLNGYTKWSLSEFSRQDFPFGTEPEIPGRDWSPDQLPETCWWVSVPWSSSHNGQYHYTVRFVQDLFHGLILCSLAGIESLDQVQSDQDRIILTWLSGTSSRQELFLCWCSRWGSIIVFESSYSRLVNGRFQTFFLTLLIIRILNTVDFFCVSVTYNMIVLKVLYFIFYQHFVMVMSKIITFFVPGIPATLKAKVLRENFLAKETFYEAETSRIQSPASPEAKRMQSPPMSPSIQLARPKVYAWCQ